MTTQTVLLRTTRLDLVATTLRHIEAELDNPQALQPLLGAVIPPGWPPGEYDRHALEFFRERLTTGGPSHVGWYGWYAITRDTAGRRDTLVAGGGYFGPPSDGSVEIGYSVIPDARERGYATELVEALVTHAFACDDVRYVMAHTSDSNIGSTRVLAKCGFTPIGPGNEPGTVQYRRERTVSSR